jgi:hypothetical protein
MRTTVLSIALAALAAFPAIAKDQEIEEGTDYWRTPANGTVFTFPAGDVEGLCHKSADPSWDHKVGLKGVPAKGSDWDSAVSRLKDAEFEHNGNTATTTVRFKSLSLASTAPTTTPCGKLNWTVRLAKGKQPTTKMTITKTSDKGGTFHADLALRVEMRATKDGSGAPVGRLFYDIKLPDPSAGTPWSFGATKKIFRAGMDENNNCLQVLRDKLGTFPPGSQHIYFISDLIAKGQCKRQG